MSSAQHLLDQPLSDARQSRGAASGTFRYWRRVLRT